MKKNIISLLAIVGILYSCNIFQKTSPKVISTNSTNITVEEKDAKVGETLYKENCAGCHRLYATTEFTADEWKPIVEAMSKEAGLNNEESRLILVYVLTNPKK